MPLLSAFGATLANDALAIAGAAVIAAALGCALAGPLRRAAGLLAARWGDARASRNPGWPWAVLLAAAFASIVVACGVSLETLELLCFTSALFVLAMVDISVRIIPNAVICAAAAARLAFIAAASIMAGAGAQPSLIFGDPTAHVLATSLGLAGDLLAQSVAGAVVVGVPLVVLALAMDRVLGRESLGGGDIKLFAVAGFYFGWQQGLVLLGLACVLGIATSFIGSVLQARRKPKPRDGAAGPCPGVPDTGGGPNVRMPRVFAFGPAIALACWITMLAGAQMAAVCWGA